MNWGRLSLKRWRIGQFLGLFCLCFLLVVSCTNNRQTTTPTGSPTTGAGNGRISVGTTLKVRTLDPADAYELASANLLYNLGDRLYTYELGTTNLQPQLATALPKVSDDGLTYTIPLRQGVVFHDGTPFNAEAMAFSLRRFMENGGQPSFLLADKVASVQPTGEYELTIKLKQPFAAFPALLSFFGTAAVSPKAYEIGAGKFKPDTFVGTGPYKLAQYGSDSIRLEVFDQYWGDKPANQGVDLQILSTPSNLFNAFRTGAVDVAYQSLDPDQIASLERESQRNGWEVATAQGNVVNYMVLNLKQKPLDNLAVRQAIASLVNRPLMNERVFRGQVEPLYTLIPPTFESSKPVFKDQYGDGDIAKAKAFLTQAGYSKDNPLKLEIWYPSNSTPRGLVASTLKALADQELEGAMQLELKSVEAATAYQNLDKGIYPTFLLDWYPDYADPDTYIQPFLDCDKGSVANGCESGATQSQGSFYYSDRAIKLVNQERQERDPKARQAVFIELQNLLAQDVPYIPLWQSKDYAFAQRGVQGVRLDPIQQLPLRTISK